MIEKRGEERSSICVRACVHDVRRVSSSRSQLFSTGIFSPAVPTINMFSAGGGALSLVLEADDFGFT